MDHIGNMNGTIDIKFLHSLQMMSLEVLIVSGRITGSESLNVTFIYIRC